MSLQSHTNEEPVNEEIKYWLKIKQDARSDALKYLEDAAKQIVTITSLLQAIYFTAVSFSNIKKVGNIRDFWFAVFVTISFITIAHWMASLYFATRVLVPEIYEASQSQSDLVNQANQVRKAYDRIVIYKNRNLRWAIKLLWFSFFPLTANIFIYLIFLPAPPKE